MSSWIICIKSALNGKQDLASAGFSPSSQAAPLTRALHPLRPSLHSKNARRFAPAVRVLFLCLVHSCLAGFGLEAALWGPTRKQPLVSLPCVFPSQHSSPLSSEWRNGGSSLRQLFLSCVSPLPLTKNASLLVTECVEVSPRQAILYDASWCPTI